MFMSAAAIAIQELKKAYGTTLALQGVDLTVQQGEIIGFSGSERCR
jgi:ABC-type multidrug transport system ATPase subunit